MKNQLLYLLLFFSLNVLSQNYSGQLVSSLDTATVVQFATIYNQKNNNYTFSDGNGNFKITAEPGDTLKINHLSFESIEVVVNDTFNHFKMNPIVEDLPEIILSNKKTPVIIENIKTKKSTIYAFGINMMHAFKVKNSSNSKSSAISLKIPIKFKRGYNSNGKIMLQFYKTITESTAVPLSKQYIIDVSKIEDSKYLKLEFEKNDLILPNSDIFIVLQRVILNKEFNKKEHYSVNPFFHIQVSDKEDMYFVKSISQNKWTELNKTNNLFTPILDVEIIADKVE